MTFKTLITAEIGKLQFMWGLCSRKTLCIRNPHYFRPKAYGKRGVRDLVTISNGKNFFANTWLNREKIVEPQAEHCNWILVQLRTKCGHPPHFSAHSGLHSRTLYWLEHATPAQPFCRSIHILSHVVVFHPLHSIVDVPKHSVGNGTFHT